MKKLLVVIILAMLIVPTFGTVVYGADNNSSGSNQLAEDIQKTDNYVHAQIDSAMSKETSLAKKLQSDIAKANKDEDVIKLNQEYTEALDGIIDHLLYTTEKKVDQLIAKYARFNIIIEKFWIPVTIGGRDILVDPCRVRPN